MTNSYDMLTILRWSLVYSQSFNSTISKHTCYDAASTMIVASSSVIAVVPLRRRPEDIDCGLRDSEGNAG